eukprot:CAMPEP_0183764476 /NCGR_PEP_ID=MMETSP0739-20130205/10318_1 /TAXON_ID=385413 /ORGANISM="Thalassiosira miniscula, Strain CCMP1093" /LENGTH=46 /DNA_ID= /DNA_START= /DNA_END= /DNA_ORIENTATION=
MALQTAVVMYLSLKAIFAELKRSASSTVASPRNVDGISLIRFLSLG